jgi:hypothetical protein
MFLNGYLCKQSLALKIALYCALRSLSLRRALQKALGIRQQSPDFDFDFASCHATVEILDGLSKLDAYIQSIR